MMRRIGAVALTALFLITSGTAARGEEGPLSPNIITDTEYGQARLAEYREMIQQRVGLPSVNLTAYKVVTRVPGDDPGAVWILPKNDPLPIVKLSRDGNRVSVNFSSSFVVPNTLESTTLDVFSVGKATQNEVSWFPARCLSRYTTTYGWFDRCTQSGGIFNDTDPDAGHSFMKYWGTCKSNQSFHVQTCGLESYKSTSGQSAMIELAWEDWAPKEDSTGACRSVSLSISSFGIGLGGAYTACDQVNITKYVEPAHFSNEFITPSAYLADRSVQYQISYARFDDGLVLSFTTNAWMTGYLKAG